MHSSPSVQSPNTQSPGGATPRTGSKGLAAGGGNSPADSRPRPTEQPDFKKPSNVDDDDLAGSLGPEQLPSRKSDAELQAAYPELFDTASLSVSEWWAHRWSATSPTGRVAAIAFIACLVAVIFLCVAWVVHDRLVDTHERHSRRADGILNALRRAQTAVRRERDAAFGVASALWAAATDPEQIELAAPPSLEVAGEAAAAANRVLESAASVSDAAMRDVVNAILAEPDMARDVFADETRTTDEVEERRLANPALLAADDYVMGSRATRNPALTLDPERRELFVSSAFLRRKQRRNIQQVPFWPASMEASSPSLASLGRFRLYELRQRVSPTLSLLPTELVDAYAAVELALAQMAARAGVLASPDRRVPPMLAAALVAAVSHDAAVVAEAARDITSDAYRNAVSDATFVARAIEFAAAVDATETFVAAVLPPLLGPVDFRRLWLMSGQLVDRGAMRVLRDEVYANLLEVIPGSTYFAAASLAQNIPAARTMQAAFAVLETGYDAPGSASDNETIGNRYIAVTVCALAGCVLLLAIVLSEQRHYTRNIISVAREQAMERVISYVADVGSALRRFDLVAASDRVADESREAASSAGLAVVHNRLLRCVACLRYLAPTIPPLLFPERSKTAAEYYAVVRRSTPSGSGGGVMDEAKSVSASLQAGNDSDGDDDHGDGVRRRRVLKKGDAASEVSLEADIEDRVCEASEQRFAVFLLLDLSTILEFQTSIETMEVAREYAPLLSNATEEAVCLHGGVFHGVNGNFLLASWNVSADAQVPDVCEAAARAAYVLAAKVNILRREDPALRSRLIVSIAITSGNVTYRCWNQAESGLSLVAVNGPPLARAAAVLYSNYHHQTTIAVDDITAEHLAACQLPSKPIELLSTALTEVTKESAGGAGGVASGSGGAGGADGRPTAIRTSNLLAGMAAAAGTTSDMYQATRRAETDGRAHELVSLARHRDPDLPARLAEYKAAFALYQRGYHAEALKAFRKYTRLYGYDGSVERIQGLILA